MQIASHNTFSYLPPKGWWGSLLNPFAKCQEVGYDKQAKSCDHFDMRVLFTKYGHVQLRHGLVVYEPCGMATEAFIQEFCAACDSGMYGSPAVRVLLETNRLTKRLWPELQEFYFKAFCAQLEERYPNVHFCGGERKHDWTRLYTFKGAYPANGRNAHSQGLAIPELYALRHNAESRAQHADTDTTLWLDFVNI